MTCVKECDLFSPVACDRWGTGWFFGTSKREQARRLTAHTTQAIVSDGALIALDNPRPVSSGFFVMPSAGFFILGKAFGGEVLWAKHVLGAFNRREDGKSAMTGISALGARR